MEIHITRDGEALGPYTIEAANQYLISGALNAFDLAWYPGISEWVPLSAVPGITTTKAPSPPLPPAFPPVPPMPPAPPPTRSVPQTSMTGQTYTDYSQVPWYRRSSINSLFILINVISFGWIPGILAVCLLVVTGDIYSKSRDDQGNLKRWGKGNKIAAFILLLFYLIFFIRGLSGAS